MKIVQLFQRSVPFTRRFAPSLSDAFTLSIFSISFCSTFSAGACAVTCRMQRQSKTEQLLVVVCAKCGTLSRSKLVLWTVETHVKKIENDSNWTHERTADRYRSVSFSWSTTTMERKCWFEWTPLMLFTHQIVIDWLLPALVVCFLDFGLFERVRYMQCTCIETAIFVVAVVVRWWIYVTTAAVVAIRRDLTLNCVERTREKFKPI